MAKAATLFPPNISVYRLLHRVNNSNPVCLPANQSTASFKVKMNLLPKTDVDFAKTEYWNKFFKERGSKEFEWYGEYAELCGDLFKYLKKEDLILVIGCGNSMLSSDLFDVGYRQITNIDISSVVIKQMKNKVGRERPGLIFEEMDVLNMSYENEKFTVVLDKGTLDALMPSDTVDDRKRAENLFSEVDRVLKINGRYIVISLLQDHILKALLDYFSERGWMIRIIRCWDVERKKIEETGCLTMPVFMVVCIKFKKMQKIQPILEVNVLVNGKPQRVKTNEEVLSVIEQVQGTIFHCKEAKGEIEIKFCRNGEDQPRYSIYIADVSQDQRKLLTYAAFIVPHGRESEWMFGTPEGRSYLCESSGFHRLAVITFHRNQDYGTMDEIQDELRQAILQLAPCFMPVSESPKVPYLTLGDGVGYRKTVYSGKSEFSGEFVVEEVEIEKETFRRLIFMSNQAVVQSEVKLKKVSAKNKNSRESSVDFSHIGSNHILYMSIPVAVKVSETPSPSVAVIGLGGGGLCLFLHKLFPKAFITGVEIDPAVVKVAEDYFGFKSNNQMKVVVNDGVKFLEEKPKYDVIMFDVDSKERGSAISCPPSQFLDASVLGTVADILGEKGIFVTNVVTRVSSKFQEVIRKIENHFALVSWYNLREDVNRIVFASNAKNLKKSEWKQLLEEAASTLDKTAQQKLKPNNQFLDLYHLVNNLTIYFCFYSKCLNSFYIPLSRRLPVFPRHIKSL